MSTNRLTLFDLVPGKILCERYELVRAHRQGGMSATFEARDQAYDASREVQVFPAALFEAREQAEAFGDRLRAWCEVGSEHVLSVHAAEVLPDGTCLLVTDFPEGPSLRSWLNENGQMQVKQAAEVGLGLLDGLIEIHSKGCVHGDIKPYTIHMVGEDASAAQLIDGGITAGLWSAKHLGDKTALIGTPFYAPVEQFGGESPDVQSDIYNLATVIFELVAGVVPWPGGSFLEVFQAKLDKSLPSFRLRAPEVEVSKEFELAVCTGLAADRGQRYSSAEKFRAALAAASR